jgi:hypothetical protein
MSEHSSIVGGRAAGRVIACPGSVQLVRRAPPQVENAYMAAGTALHEAIADTLTGEHTPDLGQFDDVERAKLDFAVKFVDSLETEEPGHVLEFDVEARVRWDEVPGAFGTVDFIGRLGDTVIVLDWKFGDGVMVDAKDNPQLMFYALAALRSNHWAFEGALFVELIIVQPFEVRRWVTDIKRLLDFEADLRNALRRAELDSPPLAVGSHCRFCPAKAICPQQTGAVERLVRQKLQELSDADLARSLELADMLEAFIAAARGLVQQKLEAGLPVPGWKLVPKRATRKWTNEADAWAALMAAGAPESELMELKSVAQMEKLLKKHKIALPTDVITAVSSGDTIAPESDPRPAKVLLGQQMTAALSKIS